MLNKPLYFGAYRYNTKQRHIGERGIFTFRFTNGELYIKRVSIINGAYDKYCIDYKNIKGDDIERFLTRVFNEDTYVYNKITEKKFESLEKVFKKDMSHTLEQWFPDMLPSER